MGLGFKELGWGVPKYLSIQPLQVDRTFGTPGSDAFRAFLFPNMKCCQHIVVYRNGIFDVCGGVVLVSALAPKI